MSIIITFKQEYSNIENFYQELADKCNMTNVHICPVGYLPCPFEYGKSCKEVTVEDWKKHIFINNT